MKTHKINLKSFDLAIMIGTFREDYTINLFAFILLL